MRPPPTERPASEPDFMHDILGLTDEQVAKIEARVATWPPLTQQQRDHVAALFAVKSPLARRA